MQPDASLLRVPTERLRATAKERTRDFNTRLQQAIACAPTDLAQNSSEGHATAQQQLYECKDALLALRQRVKEASEAEKVQVDAIKARVAHLSRLHASGPRKRARPDTSANETSAKWTSAHSSNATNQQQFDARYERCSRLLADYLMRTGSVELGSQYADTAGVSQLVDETLHRELHSVATSLKHGDASSALEWCFRHKQRLRKACSTLEFKLRLKQLVQMARGGFKADAVAHARSYLSLPAASSKHHLAELSSAMVALAAPSSSAAEHADVDWSDLATLFVREACRCYGLQQSSMLDIFVQAGLIALKDPVSEGSSASPEDPMRYPECQQLAYKLPRTKRTRSRVICPITKKIMDEDNPPLVLGNGRVYSREAMEAMARENNGKVRCVKTGDGPFEYHSLRRCYLA